MADKKISLKAAYKRVAESSPSELYSLMKEHIPAIMNECHMPFCDDCLSNFTQRMQELAEEKDNSKDC